MAETLHHAQRMIPTQQDDYKTQRQRVIQPLHGPNDHQKFGSSYRVEV